MWHDTTKNPPCCYFLIPFFFLLSFGCACNIRRQVIEDLMNDMETRGETPGEGCYTSLITAYCKVKPTSASYPSLPNRITELRVYR